MNAEQHVQAKDSLRNLELAVSQLIDDLDTGDVELPERALPIIDGATETMHALSMGGWPWLNPRLRAMSS